MDVSCNFDYQSFVKNDCSLNTTNLNKLKSNLIIIAHVIITDGPKHDGYAW